MYAKAPVMNRRERLMSTLRGEAVDRPPVCFYELNGLDEELTNDDPFNIYSHPSWAPLIELACEKTDRIVMREVPFKNAPPEALAELTEIFYISNIQGFTKKGLLPEDGELNFTDIYKHILTCIFPQRAIMLDVQEEHEENAVNAELMSAFIRQIG